MTVSVSTYKNNYFFSPHIKCKIWVLIIHEYTIPGKVSYQMHGVEFECVFLCIPFCCHSNGKCFIWYSEQLSSRCFQFPSV